MTAARALLLFAFAFSLRAVYLLELAGSLPLQVLYGDGAGYDRWARSLLADGGAAPDVFYQAPLYPYLLAGLYALVGPSPVLVYWLQAAVGAAACVLLALAGRRFFGERAGWTSGALLAIYPFAIFYTSLLHKTVLALFFLCLLLWLLARVGEGSRLAGALGAGLALGALCLLRENALALLPIVALWLAIWPRQARRRVRLARAGVLVLGTLLLLSPVAWRNHERGGGGLLPTTFQLGTNLYAGNHRGSTGRYSPPREGGGYPGPEQEAAWQLAEAASGRALDPAEVSGFWVAKTLEEIGEAPGAWLRLMLHKSLLLWNAEEVLDTEAPEVYADESRVLRVLAVGFHFGVLFPLALWGVVATLPARRRIWILYALLAGMAASVVAFFVLGRLRLLLVPILALFAGAGLGSLPRLRAQGPRRIAACAACLAAGAVLANLPLSGGIASPRAHTWNDLSVALRRAGRSDEALALLERAIAEDPAHYRAYLNKAEILRAQGRTQEAIRTAEQAVALRPDSTVARQHLAVALMDAGRTAEALAEIRRALEQDPTHAPFRSLLGLLLLQQGRASEAVPHLRLYTQARPGDPRGYNNLGAALSRAGRTGEARAAFREALRLDPAHAGAQRNLEALP